MQQNSTRMGVTENSFPWMSNAAGLWSFAERSPSPILEHSGVGGFDA